MAARTHPHWKKELARLEPRLGYNKAIVAIARKLLVAVWHVLSNKEADRYSSADQLARQFLYHAGRLGKANRGDGQTAAAYAREQLDRLGVGADLETVPRGRRLVHLPPSRLRLKRPEGPG
jgi:hypothetical protein